MGAISFGLYAAVAWGIHDILIRYVSHRLGILVSLFSVLIFGALAQSTMVVTFTTPSNISQKGLILSILAGLVFSVACIGHYNAFQRGPVRIVAPLIGCYPVLAFTIAALSGKEIVLLQWGALVALISGIGLVARSSQREPDDAPYSIGKTILYCLMAMIGFAATFELGQRASAVNDPLTTSLITRLVTTLIIGMLLLRQVQASKAPTCWPKGTTLLVIALMGLLDATALGVVLAAGIFPRPEFASAASSVFGLVTVVLAWVFMREKINLVQWTGIAAVFSAIAYLASA